MHPLYYTDTIQYYEYRLQYETLFNLRQFFFFFFFVQYINASERVLCSLHQLQRPVYRARLVLITRS